MGTLIQYLNTVSAGSVLGWIVAIIAAAACVYAWAQKYRKIKNKYQNTQTQAQDNKKEIALLREEIQNLKGKFVQEIARLDKNDSIVNEQLVKISEAISKLSDYNKAKDMNVLKDRIYKDFRNYMARAKSNKGIVYITKNELEAFEGLIESYTAAGGNSFVHKQINPDILDWVVLSEEEVTKRLGQK